MSNTVVRRFLLGAALGLGVMVLQASAQSVEGRAEHLQRRIADDIAQRRISPKAASKLEHDMDKVMHRMADARRDHHGEITRHDWAKLQTEMDRVEGRIREAEAWAPRCRDCRSEGFHNEWRRDW